MEHILSALLGRVEHIWFGFDSGERSNHEQISRSGNLGGALTLSRSSVSLRFISTGLAPHYLHLSVQMILVIPIEVRT